MKLWSKDSINLRTSLVISGGREGNKHLLTYNCTYPSKNVVSSQWERAENLLDTLLRAYTVYSKIYTLAMTLCEGLTLAVVRQGCFYSPGRRSLSAPRH